jgi:hypothetical protein
MPQPASSNPIVIPRWLVAVGSAALAAHLLAVAVQVLAAPSGPWITPYGPSMAEPPIFAQKVNDLTSYYVWPLRLNYHYRFASNRVGQPGVEFTVRLKDKDGNVKKTLTFPDRDANPWVRHRQEILARALADDQFVQRPGAVKIVGEGQDTPKLTIWEPWVKLTDKAFAELRSQKVPEAVLAKLNALKDRDFGQEQFQRELVKILEKSELEGYQNRLAMLAQNWEGRPPGQPLWLTEVQQHLVPRDREVMRPSEWSLLLVRSYARYLCREYGAASAELVRHTKEPLPPAVLLPATAPPPGLFGNEFFANFGDLPRE